MVKEGELWADVTPDMMSEEEKDGDVYIRHQPSPRLLRTLGSPHKQHVPLKCKKWTVKKTTSGHEEADDTGDSAQEPQEGQELTGFSDADSAELV